MGAPVTPVDKNGTPFEAGNICNDAFISLHSIRPDLQNIAKRYIIT